MKTGEILEKLDINSRQVVALESKVARSIEESEKRVASQISAAPFNLEQQVLQTVQLSIGEAIKSNLTSYQNPFSKLVHSVVEKHSAELTKIIEDSFLDVIRMDEFKQSIVNAFSHKIARSVISNNEGLFDKVNADLKGNPLFKAKMVQAVANIIEECLKNVGGSSPNKS